MDGAASGILAVDVGSTRIKAAWLGVADATPGLLDLGSGWAAQDCMVRARMRRALP